MLLKQSEVDTIVHMAYNPEALREWLQKFVYEREDVTVHVAAHERPTLPWKRDVVCTITLPNGTAYELYEGDEFTLRAPVSL